MIHPAVHDLFLGLARHPALQELADKLREKNAAPLSVSGLTTTAKALCAVLLRHLIERPVIVVTDGSKEAEALNESIETFHDLIAGGLHHHAPLLMPALDVLPGQGLSLHAEIAEQRAIGLWRMASGRISIAVTPIGSALLRTEPGEFYRQLALHLKVGDDVPLEELMSHLERMGYEKRDPVEMEGEYSLRGGILDVFPPEAPKPVRIELFGDTIESMRRFEVESQRSILKIPSCTLLPLTEYPKPNAPLAGGWEFLTALERPRRASLFSLLEKPVILWDEPEQIRGAAERLWKRLEAPEKELEAGPELNFYRWEELAEELWDVQQVETRELDLSVADSMEGSLHFSSRPSMAFHGNMKVAIAETRTLIEAGARVVFFAATAGEVERLADVFKEYGVGYQLGIDTSQTTPEYLANRAYTAGSASGAFLVKGNVRRGTFLSDAQVAIFGSEDLFDVSEIVARPAAKSHLASFSADLLDLKPGDFVVHAEHGVGKFLGLREMSQGEAKGDYMLIEYHGGSKLYVPLARADLVQRFRGAGDNAPALDKMGGATWTRTKTRVKARMRDMAEELLKLYAQRKLAEGFSFSRDSNWQREFEDAFEFEETRDQLTAIQEIKRDMESPQPMDRLLCGDVGFGKTEVIMRAAFKALGDGKQVAVLAPTTVLSFQHFETFKRRFQPFPVRIEMLNRFRNTKELKAAVDDLAEGKVDIAIGTHRLLSEDVRFKDLGLVIVDEEQRFGVKHKEKLKQLEKKVDVIAMSATPIPRTLHMSLLGLRDMSVIETAPKDRLAIQTTVAPFLPKLIQSALELELGRGGQVYFVHNRIDSIWQRAALLQELVPEARIAVGHGQMGEAALEKTMLSFMRHEHDILVCTTIVENGLDIPLANTIVIDHAEKYGLSELYQLRGRVGRSNRRAYAYLLVPPDSELSDLARKRLAALKEFSDLGAGFKIAALDLELRGAGNLLGGEQHGHINAVGFDMYVRMLDETVREMKGEELPPEIHSTLNLGLDLRIPPGYIGDENQRLRAYRRIAGAGSPSDREKIEQELADRYGPMPEAVRNLLDYSLLKTAAETIGVETVDRRHNIVNLKFHEQSRVEPARLLDLVRQTTGAQFTPAGVLRLPIPGLPTASGVLAFLWERLRTLSP